MDEEEFFAKLGRARKDGRAQYLRIQACVLVSTKQKAQLTAAEMLLNKILTEYPENRVEKSLTLNLLGKIYIIRQDLEKALSYFKQSLDFEKEFPNVITTSYLGFSETVVQAGKTEFYDEVESLLTKRIMEDRLKFPFENYIMYSVLSVISNFKGHSDKGKHYFELAEENAAAQTNTLWNPQKRKIGIAKERKKWLDRLVKKGMKQPS